jgi:hypothetical protein
LALNSFAISTLSLILVITELALLIHQQLINQNIYLNKFYIYGSVQLIVNAFFYWETSDCYKYTLVSRSILSLSIELIKIMCSMRMAPLSGPSTTSLSKSAKTVTWGVQYLYAINVKSIAYNKIATLITAQPVEVGASRFG